MSFSNAVIADNNTLQLHHNLSLNIDADWQQSSHQVKILNHHDFNQNTEINWKSKIEVTSYLPIDDKNSHNKSTTVDLRPTIFLLSGGAFKNLDNEIELNPENNVIDDSLKLSNKLAKLGFNVFWIKYETASQENASKIDKLFDPKSENCFYTSGSESKALFEYSSLVAFRDIRLKIKEILNNSEYQIDTNNVFISGISAGAFLSLYYLFLDKEEIPNNISYYKCNDTTELLIEVPNEVRSEGFPLPKVKGIFAIAGGSLYENIFLNKTVETSKVALGFMHGTCDEVISQNEGRLPYKYFSAIPLSIEYNQSDIERFPYAYGSKYIFDKIKKTHHQVSFGQVINGGHEVIAPTPTAVDLVGGWDQYTTNNSTSILNQRDIVFDELSYFIKSTIGTFDIETRLLNNYSVFPDNTTSLCLDDDLQLNQSPIMVADTICPNSIESATLNIKFPKFTKSIEWSVSSNLKIIGSNNDSILLFETFNKISIDTLFVTIVFNNNDKVSTYKIVNIARNNHSYHISSKAYPSNAGVVSRDSSYLQCQSVIVKALPSLGYNFDSWTEQGHVVSRDSTYQFFATSNRILKAIFVPKEYKIELNASPVDGGILAGEGIFNFGDSTSVVAKPRARFNFKSWTENGVVVSTDSVFSFSVLKDRVLTANFVLKEFSIEVLASPIEGGVLTGGGTYEVGSPVSVSAQAAEGYVFKNWTEAGQEVSTNKVMNFKATSDRILTANFIAQDFEIEITASPAEGGVITGGGIYQYGQDAFISAQPSAGFVFKDWSESGIVISTDSTYRFKVTENRFLIANFISIATLLHDENAHSISVYPNPFMDELSIDLKDIEIFKVTIYNISGEKIIETNFSHQNKCSIQTNEMSAGSYVIVIEVKNKKYFIKGVKL
ncbi:MAG: T9SS type A sorting domain-containing protein [Chitinophagales bacterium]|nr:T9SS type A sorting domain-containing protein [Chitinophagales bacterium]